MIEYKGEKYPELQAQGFAAQWCFPFAKHYCKGVGFDIGCMKKEWAFPGALPVDPEIDEWNGMNLPEKTYESVLCDLDLMQVDYIFSSHCLEHIPEHIGTVLEYWLSRIKTGGCIFLYLPNCDYQKYWAYSNKKHIHYLNPAIMKGFCHELDCSEYVVTEGYDLNGSFYTLIFK